jgi:hypothetical protein
MRIFMMAVLLNMWTYLDAQNRSDKHVYNAVFRSPERVTITGQNILIYRVANTDTLNNYSIIAYPDSVHFRADDMPLGLKPKSGVWYQPFCAYPLSEDLEIKGSLIPDFNSTGTIRKSEKIFVVKYNGVSKEYKLLTTPGKESSPSSGCIFNCKKLPGIFIFGDLADTRNQFVVTFR